MVKHSVWWLKFDNSRPTDDKQCTCIKCGWNVIANVKGVGSGGCVCVWEMEWVGEGHTLHWRHSDHDGVSNHQSHGCLLERLFRRRSKKTSKLRVTGFCAGNSPGPVISPHKGPVTRKMFPFDDVIMQKVLPITVQQMIHGLVSRFICEASSRSKLW